MWDIIVLSCTTQCPHMEWLLSSPMFICSRRLLLSWNLRSSAQAIMDMQSSSCWSFSIKICICWQIYLCGKRRSRVDVFISQVLLKQERFRLGERTGVTLHKSFRNRLKRLIEMIKAELWFHSWFKVTLSRK